MKSREKDLLEEFKQPRKKDNIANTKETGYERLLELALVDFGAATRMAHDPFLPPCLSTLAKEITQTENGVPLRPTLRKLVQDLLIDKQLCVELINQLESDRSLRQSKFGQLMYPIANTLWQEYELSRGSSASHKYGPVH